MSFVGTRLRSGLRRLHAPPWPQRLAGAAMRLLAPTAAAPHALPLLTQACRGLPEPSLRR